MADRVLHERLHDQAGNQRILHFRREVSLKPQPVTKPDPLNGQVMLEKVHLFHERNFVLIFIFERKPQQIAEMLDHLPGQPRLALHLRRNGIKRVEKKMRVQLHAQRIETGFTEARSKRSMRNSPDRYRW